LSLLVHFRVEAENDSTSGSVHECIEAVATDLGPALVPAALAATAREARVWWKSFKGDVPSMFDSMALARASFGRPFAAFLASLGPVGQSALSKAMARERSAWARHEMQLAALATELPRRDH